MENIKPLPSPIPIVLSVTTPPGTDIWRKPPSHDAFNAPVQYRKIPLASFKLARLNVKANWRTKFDQGGLCLIFPGERESETLSGEGRRRWVKTGIELMDGSPHVSTVGCDRWADWSLTPTDGNEVTVQMEREIKDGKPTSTLWVYKVNGTDKTPLREIAWAFEHEKGECWIGIYAAKPNKDEDDAERHLEVHFKDFVVETF